MNLGGRGGRPSSVICIQLRLFQDRALQKQCFPTYAANELPPPSFPFAHPFSSTERFTLIARICWVKKKYIDVYTRIYICMCMVNCSWFCVLQEFIWEGGTADSNKCLKAKAHQVKSWEIRRRLNIRRIVIAVFPCYGNSKTGVVCIYYSAYFLKKTYSLCKPGWLKNPT